jgi:hypothetical protein
MQRLTLEQLNDMLAAAARQVEIGRTYRHYKGNDYTVVDLVITEATNEVEVVYSRLQVEPQVHFVRPLKSWLEIVEHEGQQVPRFSLI